MIDRVRFSHLALVALCFVALVDCDDNPSGTGGDACKPETGTYKLTPTTPPGTAPYDVTEDYVFHCVSVGEGSVAHCDLTVYVDCADDDYFNFDSGALCAGTSFQATSHNGEYEYVPAATLRTFGSGTGPFATGVYTRTNGESGTFEFFEGSIQDPTTYACQ